MSQRNLSVQALSALTAEETGEVFLFLLTLDHETLATPIRVVNDMVGHTSRTNFFTAYPFSIVMPLDDGETFPTLKFTIDNVDQSLVEIIRTLTSPPEAMLEVVLASSPDTLELSVENMLIRKIDYNATTININAQVNDILNQKFPNRMYTPQYYPGQY